MIHCDIKPSNLLLDENLEVTIGDLGTVKFMTTESTLTGVATNLYMGPEYIDGTNVTDKVDVLAFALTAWEIVTESKIIDALKGKWMVAAIPYKIRGGLRPQLDSIKEPLKSVIHECWNSNPDERPTFDQVFKTLESANWEFIDGVHAREVDNYVQRILAKEEKQPQIPDEDLDLVNL
jgi:serine/threonine protein kinase